jgi:hypothetical protein
MHGSCRFKFYLIGFFSLLLCVQVHAADEFDTIKCGADIPKAMVGKHSPNGRVVVTEARHSDLGLKDLGGTEVSDQLFVVSWRICGNEYEELLDTKQKKVQDVLPVPAPSLHSPRSILAGCQVGGKEIHDDVIAILDNSQGQRWKSSLKEFVLPAKVAWKIDEHLERFAPMATEGLSCDVSDLSPDIQ